MATLFDSIINAAAWTLLHSIWQGFILAGIVLLFAYTIPSSNSKLRYNLFAISIFAFLCINICTFSLYVDISSTSSTNIAIGNEHSLKEITSLSELSPSYLNTLSNFIDKNTSLIFVIWLFVFVWKMAMLSRGFFIIQKIKKHGNLLENLSIIDEVKAKLNIKKTILVFESEMIKTPAISGYFKPLLFLPIGFFNQMSGEEAEAVLLHELAHIKRSDFIANILQSIIESIYFFNPALLWVSNLLKEERENCCDDMALEIHHDKKSFVNSLLYWYDQNNSKQEFTVNFIGKRMPTLNRVNRILFNKINNFKNTEKIFITACFLFTCFFGSFNNLNSEKNLFISKKNMKFDSIDFNPKQLNQSNVEMIMKSVSFNDYKDGLNQLKKTSLENKTNVLSNQNLPSPNKNEIESTQKRIELKHDDLASSERNLEILNHELLTLDHENKTKQQENEIKNREIEMMQDEIKVNQIEIDKKEHESTMTQREIDKKQHEIEMQKHEIYIKQHRLEIQKHKQETQDHTRIIKFLIKEGLIKEGKKFTMTLSKDELIVDDKKQSSELHQKIFKKLSNQFTHKSLNGTYYED
ncbi:MAG: hypothetical protein RLZZ546_1479 [Bacteroidota bacterium]|jgi:beta-lactamase regulating signal transducer with metallopeptidase domain